VPIEASKTVHTVEDDTPLPDGFESAYVKPMEGVLLALKDDGVAEACEVD